MTPERLRELAAALQLPACVYDADEVADALRAYADLLEARTPPEATGVRLKLPVITGQMVADYGSDGFLEKTDEPTKGVPGVTWSQAAVDFAGLLQETIDESDGHVRLRAADEIDRLTERLAGAYASVNLLTEMLEAKAPQEATGYQPEDSELLRYGYAPGGYSCICIKCDQEFGPADKRCRVCRPCAVKSYFKAGAPVEPGETCAWAYVDDGSWLTNCGETAILENGGTAYSDMRFCCFCGKPTP